MKGLDIYWYQWLALLEHHHLEERTVEEWDHPRGCEPCEKGEMPRWFPGALARDLEQADGTLRKDLEISSSWIDTALHSS